MLTRLKNLGVEIGARLVIAGFIAMVIARFVFGVDRYNREPVTIKQWIVFCMATVVLCLVVWIISRFVGDIAGHGSSRRGQTDRDREFDNIQAGYRLMVKKGKNELQPGYKRQEDEYKKKYGTKNRTGGPDPKG
jgi:hypothetical protein